MSARSFSSAFTVPATPAQVYDAINDVRAWWAGELDGSTSAPHTRGSYQAPSASTTARAPGVVGAVEYYEAHPHFGKVCLEL